MFAALFATLIMLGIAQVHADGQTGGRAGSQTGEQAGEQAEGVFLAGVTDLPLMAGLQEQTEQTLIFDKPNGRIIQAVATAETGTGAGKGAGGIDRDAVWQFYDGTLPQLGWRRIRGGSFVRDGEKLSIRVEKNQKILTVRFAITPGNE